VPHPCTVEPGAAACLASSNYTTVFVHSNVADINVLDVDNTMKHAISDEATRQWGWVWGAGVGRWFEPPLVSGL